MKKMLASFLLILFTFVGISNVDAAVTLDPNGNGNIITHFGNIPSSMAPNAYNQYRFKNGNGFTDIKVVTTFYRATKTSPVTINGIYISFTNTGNSSPYFSHFYVDKRNGTAATQLMSKIPKEKRLLKGSGQIVLTNLNITNAQSVNLFVQKDAVAAGYGEGDRFNYITTFY